MNIAGIDVGKSVVVYRLNSSTDTSNPRELLREGKFLTCEPTRDGIDTCLRFLKGCSTVALEPTGSYSKIWIYHLRQTGVEVKIVRHDRIAPYRKNLDLPDKNDKADALALALYLREHYDTSYRFIFGRDEVTEEIRVKVLKLGSYARLRSGLIARIKGQLAEEFPEQMNYRVSRTVGAKTPLFWRWIIGEATSEKIALKQRMSLGKGLSEDTLVYARALCAFYDREAVIESELLELMSSPKYRRYLGCFETFGLGLRTRATLLSQIYPIEKYFNELGEPDREWKGEYWRDHSLRRFKKSLGIAPYHYASGEGATKFIASGSSYCRQALLMSVLVRVEVRKNRLNNEMFEEVSAYFDRLKNQKMPAKKRRFKTAAKLAEKMYYYLTFSL